MCPHGFSFTRNLRCSSWCSWSSQVSHQLEIWFSSQMSTVLYCGQLQSQTAHEWVLHDCMAYVCYPASKASTVYTSLFLALLCLGTWRFSTLQTCFTLHNIHNGANPSFISYIYHTYIIHISYINVVRGPTASGDAVDDAGCDPLSPKFHKFPMVSSAVLHWWTAVAGRRAVYVGIWLWINTYRYSLLGDEHPFATYFDVNYRATWFWPIPICRSGFLWLAACQVTRSPDAAGQPAAVGPTHGPQDTAWNWQVVLPARSLAAIPCFQCE